MADAHAPADTAHKHAFSLAEVAAVTGLSKTTLYQELREGKLAARKVGRRTIVLKADLAAFLAKLPAA